MKNFQKLALGLIVGVMAIGGSAFTNADQKTNLVLSHMIQPTAGSFTQFSGVVDPDACTTSADRECAYDVTATGQSNIPSKSSYTTAEIDTYLSNGWIEANPKSRPALYIQ